MWEYRWAEVPAGSGEDTELTRLGADGWEAVSMAVTGEHFGKTWVRILFKRPAQVAAAVAAPAAAAAAAAPPVIDLTDPVPGSYI